MILSYILHGHIPVYSPDPVHPDPLLHSKLKDAPQILNADVNALTEHFAASRLSYSTQALPVNVLLDTLVRPSVDVEDGECITNLQWQYVPEKAVPHMVFGNVPHPGGQWTDNPAGCSEDIQTLSYATMLSLPGYSYAQHYRRVTGKDLPAFNRPARREFSDYLSAYPKAVQIDHVFRSGEALAGISRTEDGFYIRSHNIRCKHLVLASGIFSEAVRPLPLLEPLLPLQPTPQVPLLVIGSGFSAADAIISAANDQKIIHLFKWDPESRPSPLRSCHQQAYPEYAGVYRLMKRAALTFEPKTAKRPKNRRTISTPFLESRNWDDVYEGLPNAEIISVAMHEEGQEETATVTFRQVDGTVLSRVVRGLVYAVGRRGSLRYLDDGLLSEVLGCRNAGPTAPAVGSRTETDPTISGQTLRGKAVEDLEVARDVFIIGSLTGDSLIRFAYGGCVYTAGKLTRAYYHTGAETDTESTSARCCSSCNSNGSSSTASMSNKPSMSVMNGMDGHHHHSFPQVQVYGSAAPHHLHDKDDSYSVISSVADKRVLWGWWRFLVRMCRWD